MGLIKNRVILSTALIALFMTISACGAPDMMDVPSGTRFKEVYYQELTGSSSDLHIIQDIDTGCMYALNMGWDGGSSIAPLRGSDGTVLCKSDKSTEPDDKERAAIAEAGLNPDNWMIDETDGSEMVIQNKESGNKRIIDNSK